MRGRGPRIAFAALWALRIGILLLLTVALGLVYQRTHWTDEQEDLRRYVEVDTRALRHAEDPVFARLLEIVTSETLGAEARRRALVDEMFPALLRLRKLAEAPLGAGRTAPVRALCREYLEVIDGFIDACRAAIRALDDAALESGARSARIRQAFAAAAEKQRAWQEHVVATSRQLELRGR